MSRWICPRVIRGNRGDLLSRWGILWSLASLGNKEITAFCSKPQHIPSLCKGKTLPYGAFYNLVPNWKGWLALLRTRNVIWTGGLDLQDDSSLIKLLHTLCVFTIYRLLGLRIFILMQGAGPLKTHLGRWLARQILKQVEIFVARDRGSTQLLQSLGTSTHIAQGYDGIFLADFPGESIIQEETVSIQSLLQRTNDQQPVIVINLRLWFHFSSSWVPYQLAKNTYRKRAENKMNRFIEQINRTIEELRRSLNARILLVSMYEPNIEPWEDDIFFLSKIKEKFQTDDQVVLVTHDFSVPAFFSLMSQVDLVIGARLHSTLVALRGGVPAIHINYTLKGRNIFNDLGLNDYVIDIENFLTDPTPLIELAKQSLADPVLTQKIMAVRDQAIEHNFNLLSQLLTQFSCEKTTQ